MDWSKNFNLILFILSKGSDSKSPPAASGCSRCCSLRLLFAAATAASSTADHNRSFVSSRSFVRALGLLGIETKGQRERERERGNDRDRNLRSRSPWETEGEREREGERQGDEG